ncbi:endopeptidase La [Criibacterium bergeronii]|uniref:Lon protease n=1 Tax=Criibacterium bergeronii TaxID=1871336 RepID=A0A552VE59_9FIRM|nr:endopeptidase La [Criibacterium bergeronii]TRW28758.1 endopeptidase La [Criibacterium bergeronii]
MPKNTSDTKSLPIIPLRGLTIFPHMQVHFDIGREKSALAVEESIDQNIKIFICNQTVGENDDPSTLEDFEKIGTICEIKQTLRLPNNIVRILVEGISRGEIVEFNNDSTFFEATIRELPDAEIEPTDNQKALMRSIIDAFEEYISISSRIAPEIVVKLSDIKYPGELADIVAANMMLSSQNRKTLLEDVDVDERLKDLYQIILEENKIIALEVKIQKRMRKEMAQHEKDYYLKEQMKAINKELGFDQENTGSVAAKYKEDLAKLKNVSDEIREKITKEINKLANSQRSSPDAETTRDYIDTFFQLPWDKSTKEKIDLAAAQKVLDKEHFGLEKVKDRILEYLAVRKISNSKKAPILCLVGPPGVGKTSIAKSIAKSVNRKFARISLGGVRDEAQIRGHRRTYIGAIPGRIINTLISAKVNNPLILFDEIDKTSSDFKGDVASAMLEVLDPEQNKTFTDNYLEYEFDLSNVMFITTANSLDTIPWALRDRMEIIELSSYTEEEKFQIAKKYLLPKQIKEHNFTPKFIRMSDETLREIINSYTREAGVRGLEKQIAKICRKVARKKVENPKLTHVTVTTEELPDYLGKQVFRYEEANKKPEVGIVRGLAWTAVGGDTLSIEINKMDGTGKLELTGQLGDVMKESAKTAFSFVRSIAPKYNVEKDFYKKYDFHMHIPEGATPKDGPSAGVTMATAILSAAADIRVREDVAMTGEITLRGRVLPIGGLKEKLLAAHRAKIDNIVIPKENEKDIKDLPENIRNLMNITLAETMQDVLDVALVKEDVIKVTKTKVSPSKTKAAPKKNTPTKTTARKTTTTK